MAYMQSDSDKLGEAVNKHWRSWVGGALVVVPGVILAALGAPLLLTTLYLGLVVVVLGTYVVRERRQKM